ncbi:unnamed protein product [Mycena citricolor]|uniref:Uncharacterized protein n=1 Tax=Mycena citricolor TaxID=2018698 RepID=A0AAD2HA22_9AGAR|nr:unnamed protein product [Mycena citricolor]
MCRRPESLHMQLLANVLCLRVETYCHWPVERDAVRDPLKVRPARGQDGQSSFVLQPKTKLSMRARCGRDIRLGSLWKIWAREIRTCRMRERASEY